MGGKKSPCPPLPSPPALPWASPAERREVWRGAAAAPLQGRRDTSREGARPGREAGASRAGDAGAEGRSQPRAPAVQAREAGREVQAGGRRWLPARSPDSWVPAGTGWSGRRPGSWCHPGRGGERGAFPSPGGWGAPHGPRGAELLPACRRASVSPGGESPAEQPGAGSAARHPGKVGSPGCPFAPRAGAGVAAAPPALHLPASRFLHFLPEPFFACRCLCRCACAHARARGEETPPVPWEGRRAPDGTSRRGRFGAPQPCNELRLVSGWSPAGRGDAPQHLAPSAACPALCPCPAGPLGNPSICPSCLVRSFAWLRSQFAQ